ncbi:MAG: hypothetical protein ABIW83_00290 [Allosphingosinicella sp.]
MAFEDFAGQLGAAEQAYRIFDRLDDYAYSDNGPLLGISDGGDAALTVADAAGKSAKGQVAGANEARRIGLILDVERMGSAGEVPVGPDEFAAVAAAAFGRTYYSTNVGVRTNVRFHQPCPEVAVAAGGDAAAAAGAAIAMFKEFLRDPAGNPRPVCVRLILADGVEGGLLTDIVGRIEASRGSDVAPASLHRIAVLRRFDRPPSDDDEGAIGGWIEECATAGVAELALDGPWAEAARVRLGIQGLLNVMPAALAARMVRHAADRGVQLVHRCAVDLPTTIRTIFAGLHTARAHGLNAAKYGLVPLTLDEQRLVVRQIQVWTAGWTAVPAFYADTPLVTRDEVYYSDRVVEAARLWLTMAHEEGARLVLFDCPDRFAPRVDVSNIGRPRALVKKDAADVSGAFTLEEIGALRDFAENLGIGVLWSGGIRPVHAFELGRLGVAGFFTTGSTAVQVPVGPSLEPDPRLISQASPTELGVRRVHALAQAGFLTRKLGDADGAYADRLAAARPAVEAAAADSPALRSEIEALDALLISGWRQLWER